MLVPQENRCGSCSKVFCCPTCRLAHENAKHAQKDPKCSICRKRPLQIKNLDDSELVCHVVFNHLPLNCRLCGEHFRNSDELKKQTQCKWWSRKKITPSILIDPSTPQLHSPPAVSSNPQKDFNSPPEFSRHTSTPLQCANFNPALKNLDSLKNFFLKTTKNLSFSSLEGKFSSFECTSSTGSDRFYSGRSKSELDSKRHSSSNNKMDSAVSNTSSTNLVELKIPLEIDSLLEFPKLTPSEDNKENEDSAVMLRRSDASEKRVRFSDQNDVTTLSDNETFFEANDASFDIPREHEEENNDEKQTETEDNDEKKIISEEQKETGNEGVIVVVKEEKQDEINEEQNEVENENLKELQKEENENQKNECREYCHKCNENSGQILERNEVQRSKNIEREEIQVMSSSTASSSTTSSRLLMMVVVEKSTGRFSTSSLAPLIDSELKKLEQKVTNESEAECPDTFSTNLSKLTCTTEDARRTAVDEDYSSVSHGPIGFSSEHDINSSQSSDESSIKKSDDPSKSDGIFSVVARAVKSALMIFPGSGSSQDISREPLLGTSGSSSDSFSFNESKHRRNKRPREIHTESVDDIYSSRYCPYDASHSREVVRSPAAKRQRGWYRIKGREPIDRMKNKQEFSLRGVSLETQCFQQGSLTVKNSILPIPSRAHQYTQTDY